MIEIDKYINQIICGDCLEVMKDWPDECIDMALTSPPYGNLRDYKGYVFDFKSIANQLFRVIKKGGVLVWVVGDQVIDGSESGESFRQALYFKSIGFNLHDTMIYEKTGIPFPESNRYNQIFEYMFILSKNKPLIVNLIKETTLPDSRKKTFSTFRQPDGTTSVNQYALNKETRLRTNIWRFATGYGHNSLETINYDHPATFPEDLAKDHIISWSNPDDIILDPMVGSGTTPKKAKLLGRRFIGIDISEAYCKIARARLEAVDTGVPVKEQRAGQMAMFPVDK